jgi:hypothetical protein
VSINHGKKLRHRDTADIVLLGYRRAVSGSQVVIWLFLVKDYSADRVFGSHKLRRTARHGEGPAGGMSLTAQRGSPNDIMQASARPTHNSRTSSRAIW